MQFHTEGLYKVYTRFIQGFIVLIIFIFVLLFFIFIFFTNKYEIFLMAQRTESLF